MVVLPSRVTRLGISDGPGVLIRFVTGTYAFAEIALSEISV